MSVTLNFHSFVKSLISGLTSLAASTYQLVKTLAELVKRAGSKTLVEGVESEDIVRACQQLGIDYTQGFFYSQPTPITSHIEHAVYTA